MALFSQWSSKFVKNFSDMFQEIQAHRQVEYSYTITLAHISAQHEPNT